MRAREIATIEALTAMGNAAPQLKVHIEAGLNVGLSRDEITEIIMQMAVYAGFPAALNGLFAAKEVFASRSRSGSWRRRRDEPSSRHRYWPFYRGDYAVARDHPNKKGRRPVPFAMTTVVGQAQPSLPLAWARGV